MAIQNFKARKFAFLCSLAHLWLSWECVCVLI